MNFNPFAEETLAYLSQNSSPEPELLQELSRETHVKMLKPRMLSGHIQGRFLSMLSNIIRPLRILEIGTFTGYATLCLAEGLPEDGKIITIESNPEHLILAQKYFDRSLNKNKIFPQLGQAQNIIPTLVETYDIVFIDADKKNNQLYFDLVINNVKSGGIILVDNVLWSGKVLQKQPQTTEQVNDVNRQDPRTGSIRKFNTDISSRNDIQCILLPLRDGIMMIRKL
jgi:caffeoyl-CoA O-methyltransferase